MADKDAEMAKNLLDAVDKTVITPKTDLGDETTFILPKDGDTQDDPLTEKSKPLVPQSPSDKPTTQRPLSKKKAFDAAGVSQDFLKPEHLNELLNRMRILETQNFTLNETIREHGEKLRKDNAPANDVTVTPLSTLEHWRQVQEQENEQHDRQHRQHRFSSRDHQDYTSDYGTTDSMDKRIQELRNETGHNFGQGSVLKLKTIDVSITMLKTWSSKIIRDNQQDFGLWNRRAISYFSSVGLKCLTYMDPWTVPKTLDQWNVLDDQCRHHKFSHQFMQEIRDGGFISTTVQPGDTLIKLNCYYLVYVSARGGLKEAFPAAVESAIDYDSMRMCLPPTELMMHEAAGRFMYFNVYNHFMLNTETTRLNRLEYIQSNLFIESNDSIKTFANKLRKEATVLNLMSTEIQVTEAMLMAILKKRVREAFPSDIRYWTELKLLSEYHYHGRSVPFEILVTKWEELFEENKADKSLTSGQAYQLRLDSSETKADPLPVSHQQAHFSKTEKKKITKDSNGKNICWQYQANKKCKFGTACKFSHSFDSDTVAAAYYSQEISEKALEQVYAAGLHKGKKKMHGKTKYQNKSSSNPSYTHKPSAHPRKRTSYSVATTFTDQPNY